MFDLFLKQWKTNYDWIILSTCMTQPRTFYMKDMPLSVQGSSISILNTEQLLERFLGKTLRGLCGVRILTHFSPNLFSSMCLLLSASKRDGAVGAVRHFEIRGNPLVILVDFLEMEVSLRASGRHHCLMNHWNSTWRTCRRSSKILAVRCLRPSGVVQLLCESEDFLEPSKRNSFRLFCESIFLKFWIKLKAKFLWEPRGFYDSVRGGGYDDVEKLSIFHICKSDVHRCKS